MERRSIELSHVRMGARLGQYDGPAHQNRIAAGGLANFRVKSMKSTEITATDGQCLIKSVLCVGRNRRNIQRRSS
jgi:hypothetical protein